MRSLWAMTVVAAATGGAVGASLGWWFGAAAGHEVSTPPGSGADEIARIERRLAEVEVGLARAMQPAATLGGAPEGLDGPRARTQEAKEASRAGVASDVEELKSRVAALAAALEVLERKAGVPLPWPNDPAEVERIRERWRSRLEESEKALWSAYPQGPDPRGDPVGWSRFESHRRAKAAFEAATDSASLRALSEGEFRNYFAVTR